MPKTCAACGGDGERRWNGHRMGEPCPRCKGAGSVPSPDDLERDALDLEFMADLDPSRSDELHREAAHLRRGIPDGRPAL